MNRIICIILITILFASCRTHPKSASSEKPVIPEYKIITQFNYSHGFPIIDIPNNDDSHFLILEDSYPRAGLNVNLINGKCEPFSVNDIKDYSEHYSGANELRRINQDKANLKIRVELKGNTNSYKIYTFSEGWSPIPNNIWSNTLPSFTGELRVIQSKNGHDKLLINQRVKNWIPDEFDRKLVFSGNYKYLLYIDEEYEGKAKIYVINL